MFSIALEFSVDSDINDYVMAIPTQILNNQNDNPKIKAFILVPSENEFFKLSVNGETIFHFENQDELPGSEFIVQQLERFLSV